MHLANSITTREQNISNIEEIKDVLENAGKDLEVANEKTAPLVKALQEKNPDSSEPSPLGTLNLIAQFVSDAEPFDSANTTLKKTQELRAQASEIKEEAALLIAQIHEIRMLMQDLQGVYDKRLLTNAKIDDLSSKVNPSLGK